MGRHRAIMPCSVACHLIATGARIYSRNVLDVPTICAWEHPPAELADQILSPRTELPSDSRAGARDAIRRALNHPRLIHWSRDTGHTKILHQLGFVSAEDVLQLGYPLTLASLPQLASAEVTAAHASNVAFIGHFYQDNPPYNDVELAAVASNSIAKWMQDIQVPLWDVLTHEVKALSGQVRRRLALDQDQSFFWPFAHRLIVNQAQTAERLHLLGAAGVPITCYGNLDRSLPGVPSNISTKPERLNFHSEVPAVFAHHPIVVDVLNPGTINGYTEKVLIGFAAGGFVLIDRKTDFVDAFGEVSEAVSYTNGDDLRAKIDRYLTKWRLRRELASEMRARVASSHTLPHVLGRLIQMASERILDKGLANTDASARFTKEQSNVTILVDLLPMIHTYEHWSGALVTQCDAGVFVETPSPPWSYAAEIRMPPSVQSMNEPHLRLNLTVEAGRVGVALLCLATGALSAEQFVSVTRRNISLTLELPKDEGVALILRNTIEGQSRALISSAALVDRLP